MGRKGRKRKRQPVGEVKVIGPPVRELVERVRVVLEEELWHKEKRYQDAPTKGLEWTIRRYERALDALEELERRSMQ